ncbi:hypothetical protein ACMYYO_06705 [Dermacoccaceae bacterium W4C1]
MSARDEPRIAVHDAYQRYYGVLVAWTERLLGEPDGGHRDAADTDAAVRIVTEAFVGLVRRPGNARHAQAWLYLRIARQVRAEWRRGGEQPGPDGQLVTDSIEVADLIRELPPRLRQTAMLHRFAGLGIDRIASLERRAPTVVHKEARDADALMLAVLQAGRVGSGDPAQNENRSGEEELAAYFSAQRAAMRPVAAGADHWEQIQHEASSADRSWFTPVSMAVAVLATAVLAWSLQQAPFAASDVSAGRPVSKATSSADVTGAQGEAATSPAQSARDVPRGYIPWSYSDPGSGTLFALGRIDCAEEVCPGLVRSTDNGSSWALVHSFSGSDTADVDTEEVPAAQPARALTGVRFADPRIGYVFGGDLWRTADGGRSFTRFAHPGETVLDVQVRDGRVVVLTADGCTQGRCTGPLMISSTTSGADSVSTAQVTQTLSSPVSGARLVLTGGEVFVQPEVVDQPQAPWRVSGNRLIPLAARAACGTSPLQSTIAIGTGAETGTNGVSGAVSSTLLAACARPDSGGSAHYRLVRSTDGGRSWTALPATVDIPRIGRLSLAAPDGTHLIAAAGGPRTTASPTRVSSAAQLLQVSADAGRTWQDVSQPSPPAAGIDSLQVGTDGQVVAVSRTTSALWRSQDAGRTWNELDPTVPAIQEIPPSGAASQSPTSSSSPTSTATRSGS